MKFKALTQNKNYCIKLEKGEEALNSLIQFCIKNKISNASFSGIGATNNLTVGSFDLKNRRYIDKTFNEPLEILSLVGNISLVNKKPFAHAHIIAGKENFIAIGGHVKQCYISLTCEIYLVSYKQPIERIPNKDLGISILEFKK
jgi:predicted DNA-binding protein with PD1-like motif